jgi:hypothetical protein
MSRCVVQYDNPQGVRITVEEAFKVRPDLLMPFPLVNRIQPFAGRIFETPQEGIPGILDARRLNPALLTVRDIAVSHIRAPMEISRIKKRQSGRYWGAVQNRLRGLRDIMAGQFPRDGFF